MVDHIRASPPLSQSQIAELEQRIGAPQARVGYTSDYGSWIAKVTPPDLELTLSPQRRMSNLADLQCVQPHLL